MANARNVKNNIIEVTTRMIEDFDGDTKKITARMIAKEADVALGLINYHFGSKENLITICVQRVIGKAIIGASMQKQYDSEKERMLAWALYVFEFLFEYPAISRISILGEFQSYGTDHNPAYLQRGFMFALTKNFADKDKPILSFILTAAMQAAFLRKDAAKDLLGYDFKEKEEREAYVKKIVDVIFDGSRKTGIRLSNG